MMRAKTTCAIGAALLVLAACSRGNEAPLEDQSAEQIFARGEYQLEVGRADDAAEFFGEVERLYPYSELAKRALIMQAFAYHQDKDYPNSRALAHQLGPPAPAQHKPQ